ncbi:hypothetical protein TNCV_1728821 [Trichonephila clavipes]|nr:hypothetical protein TNCV_1728821 [Trichonephila clavipes]
MGSLSFAFSPQLVKMLQVSRKSIGFHHGALGNVIVLVKVVRQGAVIQIPEMEQYFQVDGKKSKLFKNFPLVRALGDDEATVRQIPSGSLPSSGMLAIDNSIGTGWPPW